MDLKKYVPREMAEAKIAAAEGRVEMLQEAIAIMQEELNEAEVAIKAANDSADERISIAKKEMTATIELAEANMRADLTIAQAATAAECARADQCIADMDAAQTTIEQQRKALQEAIVKAATEERLRLAAEKRPGKQQPAAVMPMPTIGYTVEGFRRDSNGDLASFSLMPKKAH